MRVFNLREGMSQSHLSLRIEKMPYLMSDTLQAFNLPICGIISTEPLLEIARQLEEVESACHRLGCNIPKPFLTFQPFCFTGPRFLSLSDRGLVNVRPMKLVPLIA